MTAQLCGDTNTTETPSREIKPPEENKYKKVRFTETIDVIMDVDNDSEEQTCRNTNKPDHAGTTDPEEMQHDKSLHVSRSSLGMKVDELKLTQGEPKCGIQTKEDQRPTTVIMSCLKGNTADRIIQVQDELIKHGVNGSLRTRKDNLHITYVAIFINNVLENISNDAVKHLMKAPEFPAPETPKQPCSQP